MAQTSFKSAHCRDQDSEIEDGPAMRIGRRAPTPIRLDTLR
jgi:hypothetical protein